MITAAQRHIQPCRLAVWPMAHKMPPQVHAHPATGSNSLISHTAGQPHKHTFRTLPANPPATVMALSRTRYTTPSASGGPLASPLLGRNRTMSCGDSLCGGSGSVPPPCGTGVDSGTCMGGKEQSATACAAAAARCHRPAGVGWWGCAGAGGLPGTGVIKPLASSASPPTSSASPRQPASAPPASHPPCC